MLSILSGFLDAETFLKGLITAAATRAFKKFLLEIIMSYPPQS